MTDVDELLDIEQRRIDLENAGLMEPRMIWTIDVWYDGDTDVYVGWKLDACQRAVVAWAESIWDELYRDCEQLEDPIPEEYPSHMSTVEIFNILEAHERVTMQCEQRPILR